LRSRFPLGDGLGGDLIISLLASHFASHLREILVRRISSFTKKYVVRSGHQPADTSQAKTMDSNIGWRRQATKAVAAQRSGISSHKVRNSARSMLASMERLYQFYLKIQMLSCQQQVSFYHIAPAGMIRATPATNKEKHRHRIAG
jgi:hypothetical protein